MIDDDNDDDFETVMVDGRPARILKDGRRMRVPMMMADGLTPARRKLHDGQGGPVGHRPGFIYTTDARAADLKQAAYGAYEDALVNAYKDPVTGAGSHEFIGQQEGDLCTINGAPGHMRRVKGTLTCVPDQKHDGAHAAREGKTEAYDAYDAEITNAWRHT